jgi:hypothetical protein
MVKGVRFQPSRRPKKRPVKSKKKLYSFISEALVEDLARPAARTRPRPRRRFPFFDFEDEDEDDDEDD